MDKYVDTCLAKIDLELMIYKINKGKIRWHVAVGQRSEMIGQNNSRP